MCFVLSNKNDKAQVAQEDIIVYKSGVRSLFGLRARYVENFVYRRFKTQPIEKLDVSNTYYNDEIYKGYHSCKDAMVCGALHGKPVHIFVIPKGAEYCENEREYVSNTIRWMGKDNKLTRLVMKLRKEAYGRY